MLLGWLLLIERIIQMWRLGTQETVNCGKWKGYGTGLDHIYNSCTYQIRTCVRRGGKSRRTSAYLCASQLSEKGKKNAVDIACLIYSISLG